MFDGAKSFGCLFACFVVGALIFWGKEGMWTWRGAGTFVAILVALYFLLVLANRFEERDIHDRRKADQKKRR